MWIPDRGEDDRPVRRTAGRMEGTRNGRTCAGCPRTNALDSPPTRAKWGATIRPPTTSPCTRSLAPFPLTLPVCAFPHPRSWEGLPRQRPYSALRRLDIRKRYAAKVRFGPGAATAPPRPCKRRLASVLRRPGPRSAIVGDYSGLKCCRIVLVKCPGGMRPAV